MTKLWRGKLAKAAKKSDEADANEGGEKSATKLGLSLQSTIRVMGTQTC